VYGFYEECLRKYGSARIWQVLTDLFDSLPLAAVIENQLFCPHAGEGLTLDKMQQHCCGSSLSCDRARVELIHHQGSQANCLAGSGCGKTADLLRGDSYARCQANIGDVAVTHVTTAELGVPAGGVLQVFRLPWIH
jgi:hypothetical protein